MNELIDNIPMAIFIIAGFYILSLFIDRLLRKFSDHVNTGTSEVFRLLSNSQRAVLLLVAIIMATSQLGFDVSALIAGLGLTGFALGFAFKDAVSNLIAGVMIVIYKPCGIGDYIELSGTIGEITDINLRYLTVDTGEGKCLIPNSLILNNKLMLLENKSE